MHIQIGKVSTHWILKLLRTAFTMSMRVRSKVDLQPGVSMIGHWTPTASLPPSQHTPTSYFFPFPIALPPLLPQYHPPTAHPTPTLHHASIAQPFLSSCHIHQKANSFSQFLLPVTISHSLFRRDGMRECPGAAHP